jgi:hypothetical protein
MSRQVGSHDYVVLQRVLLNGTKQIRSMWLTHPIVFKRENSCVEVCQNIEPDVFADMRILGVVVGTGWQFLVPSEHQWG